jgi:D-glycero-D-manno-heptose 1,7-bisphosphate phosphatase
MASHGVASKAEGQPDPVGIVAMKRKAVFLDRDGVLNEAVIRDGKPYPPSSIAELVIGPEIKPALLLLRNAGFLLIVVSNQPDVSRGKTAKEDVEVINAALRAQLPLDEIRTCYHDDADQCSCRKPAPGMLLEAALAHKLDLSACFIVGDRWRDVEAGLRAGCKTVFLDRGYREKRPAHADRVVRSLPEAVAWILSCTAVDTSEPSLTT